MTNDDSRLGRPPARPRVVDLAQTQGMPVELAARPGDDQLGHSDPRVQRTRARALATARHLAIAEGPDAVTHVRVARDSGVGRRTLYRHWGDSESLLHDALAEGPVQPPTPTGNLREDLIAYLEALRAGLVHGDLALVLHMLGERASSSELLAGLRARLVSERCQPLRSLLCDAAADGRLTPALDIDEAAAALEGPLFYRVLVRGEHPGVETPTRLVDRFLDAHEHLSGGERAGILPGARPRH